MKPAYLLTLNEYQTQVVPLIKELQQIIKKNNAFKFTSYGLLSYDEYVSYIKENGHVLLKYQTPQEIADYEFNALSKDISDDTVNRKNEILNKLITEYAIPKQLLQYDKKDLIKSNKKLVRNAMQDGLYINYLLKDELTMQELEKIADSVDVKIPKKILETSPNTFVVDYKKEFEMLDTVNKAIVEKAISELEAKIKPIDEKIYKAEYERILKLVNEQANAENVVYENINVGIQPYLVYNYKTKNVTIEKRVRKKYYGEVIVKVLVAICDKLILKPDYEKKISIAATELVNKLRANLVRTILEMLYKINNKISQIHIHDFKVGLKGYEATMKFDFENGSTFSISTNAVGAGGYNIQQFHYRYLTEFINVILPDGTKINNPTKYDIAVNFSNQKSDTDMLADIDKYNSTEELAKSLYKTILNGKFVNIYSPTINILKKDVRIFYKTPKGNKALYMPIQDLQIAKTIVKKFMENTEQKYKTGGKITPSEIKTVNEAINRLENNPKISVAERANAHKYKVIFDKLINETDEEKLIKITNNANTFIKKDDLYIGKKNTDADIVRMYIDALITSRRKEVVKNYNMQPLYDWLNEFIKERQRILSAKPDFVNNPKTNSEKDMAKIIKSYKQIIDTIAMPEKIGMFDESSHRTIRAEILEEFKNAQRAISKTQYPHYYETFSPRLKKIIMETTGIKKLANGGSVVDDLDQLNVKKEGNVYVGKQTDKSGGIIVGKRHSECDDDGCGEKFKVGGTGQVIEVEGGEIVMGAESMNAGDKYEFEGKKMTPRQIASFLNVKGGGVKFDNHDESKMKGGGIKVKVKMAHGGEVADKVATHFKGGEYIITVKGSLSKEKYNFQGKQLTPREILSNLNSTYGGKAF